MVIEILTGVLAVITAFYAWVTYKILRANEKVVEAMREQAVAMTRPYVVIAPGLTLDSPTFYLRISNQGKTSAMNLRLTLDKPFHKYGESAKDHDLTTFNAFTQPIDSFPPGSEIVFTLAQGFKVFANSKESPTMPHTFSVTADYEFNGQRVKEENHIDLRPYLGANIPQDPHLTKLGGIIDSLNTIAKNVAETP
ncbi:hypothetical protein [Geothrix mesophila]|uniref:hypothetical protein n=1 Tax=Geothrix mesophila TaxID=2922723 RepID=UPI001FAD90CB|nr:hypothetical protein [Geothrix sp. SG198]